jgi:predicted nucleic acid-binding protein
LIAYADTGFLISLYGEDDLSAAASALVKSRPVFILTPFGEVEFSNALELRVFRQQWTRREARAVHELFRSHQRAGVFQVEELRSEVWEAALSLSRRRTAKLGSRTLDLLHVAAVLVYKPDVFFTFDERQRKLAKAERLRILPA